jgi:hypothetical protein
MQSFKLKCTVMGLMIFSFLGPSTSMPLPMPGPQVDTHGSMHLMLYFIPNQGQFHEQVAYCAKAANYTIWITEKGITFDTALQKNSPKTKNPEGPLPISIYERLRPIEYTRKVCRASFTGANESVQVIPVDITDHKVNFFMGNQRLTWLTDIPTSQSILYKNLYPKIDLKVCGRENTNEYEFIIHPGGNTFNIVFTYEECGPTKIDKEGNLVIENEPYEFHHRNPKAYRISEESPKSLDVQIRQIGDDSFGYTVAGYDKNSTIVIKQAVSINMPEKDCGSCERGYKIAVDPSGEVYVTGQTTSSDFPLEKPHRTHVTCGKDVFVKKINASGTALVYTTFFGGTSCDYGKGIYVDAKGSAYVTGITDSEDFPSKMALFSTSSGGFDAFIAKFDPSGSELVYSSFLGGSDHDSAQGITVDRSGAVCVAGWTHSLDFPIQNALIDNLSGIRDGFVAKIDPSGSRLLFSTYLGGDSFDFAKDIAADQSGSVWVTGYTSSGNFPTRNALFPLLDGKLDAFVTQLSESGNTLAFSTYFGGGSNDIGNAISIDSSGDVYITGYTDSKNFPVKNAWNGTLSGGVDAYIAKISVSDKSLVYSTFLGGTSDDSGCGIAVDPTGAAYITGYTSSKDFPLRKSPYESLSGDRDAFVTKINPAGDALSFSTFLGGQSCDCGKGITVDRRGAAYVTGYTNSSDFPKSNEIDATFSAKEDAFIVKLNVSGSALVYSMCLGGLKGSPLNKAK